MDHHIFDSIQKNVNANKKICWIVSDYKFNNVNYPQILDLKNEFFLDDMGHPGNIDKNY